ncbi:MAG TPA: sulfite exporter TauE/SafE family protein [Terriglobia bacterium]|nr:sulfite exporter TauE/SafE family protein [Terriglobia bacterium]
MVELWIGLAGGILIGATGAGIGLLVTPLLILAGYRPAVAIGTALGVAAVSKIAGAIVHHRLGHWPGRRAWILMAGGVAGAAFAWWIVQSRHILAGPHADLWLRRTVAIALLVAALAMLLTRRDGSTRRTIEGGSNPTALLLTGLGLAPLEALTSVGSGTLLGPVLASTTAWDVPQLAAVGNLFGWMVGLLSAVLYFQLGDFNAPLFAKVLVGLMPGLFAGALLSRRIDRRWYVRILGVMSACLAARLLL